MDSRDTGTSSRAPSGRVPAPHDGRHVVARGDTLYSIAFRYGEDYRDLARWNGIEDPYVILPGQSIRLTAPPAAKRQAARPAEPRRSAPLPAKEPARASARVPSTQGPLQWRWPAPGRVLRSDSPTSKKGVDIAGRKGESIIAAAPGVVVYSGSGLLGYGQLIIIKHSDTYLSAYAYNEQLLVREGDRVADGQAIATMGLGNDGRPVLHFQIRKDGKPVNPLDYLPKRSS
ncbi:MAG TPA: peptidoglycan DD-metalloendopeptidase family protein [Gammaproteobacteria bacterium]